MTQQVRVPAPSWCPQFSPRSLQSGRKEHLGRPHLHMNTQNTKRWKLGETKQLVNVFLKMYLFSVNVLLACMSSYCVCVYTLCPEARRKCWITWNWSYKSLCVAMWALGMEPGFSARMSALTSWAIPLTPEITKYSYNSGVWNIV